MQNTVPKPLVYTAKEMAMALKICEKTLWTMTQDGTIPSVRIGKRVLYSVERINEFLNQPTQQ